MPNHKLQGFLKALGPGILFACTAIGVSHLVQSTRAGANYGFALLWAVALANIFKYPFFEYGSRYANVTKESIIDGYARIGKGMLVLYFVISLVSMLFVSAAVGAVTAGFLDNLFNINALSGQNWTALVLLFVVCIGLLLWGRYSALDAMLKVVGALLLITTLVAFVLTLKHGPVERLPDFQAPAMFDHNGWLFIIALMGWMPSAVDLSSWNSLWTLERAKQTGYYPSLKETLTDFNIGYWVSAFLSICFVTMGAFLMYGTGEVLPSSSAQFAHRIVQLYTATMGEWSYFVIAACAFSVMFSTSITVFDGYARALNRTTTLLFDLDGDAKKRYAMWLLAGAAGALIIILQFSSALKQLVDIATIISFVIAPVIAVVNFKLVRSEQMTHGKPGIIIRVLSYGGIVFLSGFTLLFFWVKLGFSH